MALPDYIKRAKNNYNSKFELIQLRLPEGAKGRIKAIIGDSGSMAAFCVDAVMEAIEGYEAAAGWIQEEPGPQGTPSERPQEPQKEGNAGSVGEAGKNAGRLSERQDNAVRIADLQAMVDRKRQEQEERKEKLEQGRKERREAEREQNRAEMRAYVEKLRDGARENREQAELVCGILQDAELLRLVLNPDNRDKVISDLGQGVYDAMIVADKERKREESKQAERVQGVEELPDFMSGI